jgi:hypothetical protein
MATSPFEYSWNAAARRFAFALHGRWDSQIMADWDTAQRAVLRQVPSTGWTILANLTDYLPQSEEIQKGHEALMALSAQKGMTRAAVVMSESVAAMQIRRLSGQAHANDKIVVVTSVAEAERVLASAQRTTSTVHA